MGWQDKVARALSSVGALGAVLLLAWAEPRMDSFQVILLHLWAINTIFALAFNLIYGYTGQFSLGHAGLAAVGGYTLALLTLSPSAKASMYLIEPPIWPISVVHWPFLPSLVLAGILAAVAGLMIGVPCLRLRGDYLVMVTLGFSEIIRLVLANLMRLSNGPLGLKGIPGEMSLSVTWGLAILTIFTMRRLVDSSYGRALKAIREDEIAAEALGVSLPYHKIMAFVISSFFVGIGGALYVKLLRCIDPNAFGLSLTVGAITMVVLGGAGSITGSFVAAGVYTLMSEVLRIVESPRVVFGFQVPPLPGARMLAFAIMLLALTLFYRRGLMGENELSWRWAHLTAARLLRAAASATRNSTEENEE